MLRLLTSTIKPWEAHPTMLEAVHRMTAVPEGRDFSTWGSDFMRSTVKSQLASVDSAYADDVAEILDIAASGLMASFVAGRIKATDILPGLGLVISRIQPPG